VHILTQFQVETQFPPHFGFPAPIKTCLHLQRDAHLERVVRFVAYLPSAAPAPAAAAAVELTEGLLGSPAGRRRSGGQGRPPPRLPAHGCYLYIAAHGNRAVRGGLLFETATKVVRPDASCVSHSTWCDGCHWPVTLHNADIWRRALPAITFFRCFSCRIHGKSSAAEYWLPLSTSAS